MASQTAPNDRWRPFTRSLRVASACTLTLLAASIAPTRAQDASTGPVSSAESTPATGTDTLKRLPRGAYVVDPAIGIPAQTLFRDTGAPYTNSLRPLSASPSVRTDSAELGIHLDLPSVHGRFPLLDRGRG